MKCYVCGTEMLQVTESYRYQESGLPGVTLGGVTVHRCPNCGEEVPEIPKIEKLHALMRAKLAEKRSPLLPGEITFIRKALGWGAQHAAHMLKVEERTVHEWEAGKQEMPREEELLLRLYAIQCHPIENYGETIRGDLEHAESQRPRDISLDNPTEPTPFKQRVDYVDDNWRTPA